MDARASHQLSFDDMQLFARVCALGTLSAVARERDAPVSQISRALQRIEQAFGVRLVNRSTHGLSLTAEGHTLHEYCLRMLGTLHELDAEFAGRGGAVHGLVTVSTSSVMAEHLIVPSLPSLQTRHPHLRLDLRVDDRVVDMARDGIDIAIRTGKPVTDTLVMRSLGRLRRSLYASPAYVKAHGLPRSVEELASHRLISNSSNAGHNRWTFSAAHGTQSVFADGGYRSDSTSITAAMTLAGLGIGRIIALAGESLVAQGRLVPVLADSFDPDSAALNAVMLAQRHRHPKIRACIDHWVDWFAKIDKT